MYSASGFSASKKVRLFVLICLIHLLFIFLLLYNRTSKQPKPEPVHKAPEFYPLFLPPPPLPTQPPLPVTSEQSMSEPLVQNKAISEQLDAQSSLTSTNKQTGLINKALSNEEMSTPAPAALVKKEARQLSKDKWFKKKEAIQKPQSNITQEQKPWYYDPPQQEHSDNPDTFPYINESNRYTDKVVKTYEYSIHKSLAYSAQFYQKKVTCQEPIHTLVTAQLIIERSGKIRECTLHSPTKNAQINDAIRQWLLYCSPPPFPPEITSDVFTCCVYVNIDHKVGEGTMRFRLLA